jgi:Tol biopolymer transport system component
MLPGKLHRLLVTALATGLVAASARAAAPWPVIGMAVPVGGGELHQPHGERTWIAAPTISADARLVAFVSGLDNLVPGDRNLMPDVFVRDWKRERTELISAGRHGGANGASRDPVLSSDGRYVAFVSDATNLIAGDANAEPDVFVADLRTLRLERASVTSSGAEARSLAPAVVAAPAISADGRYVAFGSSQDLVPRFGLNGGIYLRDRLRHATLPVLRADAHAQLTPRALSAGGLLVLARPDPGEHDGLLHSIWLYDPASRRLSCLAAPTANTSRSQASISSDGRYVAWLEQTLHGDRREAIASRIVVLDRRTRVRRPVETAGVERGLGRGRTGEVGVPRLAPDGSAVVFQTTASRALGDVTHGDRGWDVYRRDLRSGQLRWISRAHTTHLDESTPQAPDSAAGLSAVVWYGFIDPPVGWTSNAPNAYLSLTSAGWEADGAGG